MDSRRRAELLASLSPEGRATYEILRAQLARDLDWSFAESNSRLQKAMAATAPTTPAASEASTTNWAATAVLAATTANTSTPGSVQTATAADISTPATASAPSAHTATSTCVPIVAVLDSTPPRVQAVTATAPTAAARVDLNLKRGIDHLVGSSAARATNPSDVITPATAASAAIATSPRSTSSTASWTAASVGVATASASSTMSPAAEALLMRTMGSQNPASSIPVPVVTVSASHDSDLALATPTMCSTECPGEENSATRVTPTHIGALLASPTSAQKMNTSSLWHAIAVSEFSSSQVHHLLRCELPKFVTALVCLPLLPWDGKYMWLPPDPLYGLKSKSRLLEHDMRDCFLFVKRDNSHIIHVHASIDEDALFIIGNRRAQQSLCQWRVSQLQGRLQEGNIGRAEAIVSSGMFLPRRNFQLALLYAVVLYCSGASDSLPVAIALDRSEQFSWIIAWLPRAFPDCSRIIAEKFCNVMAVPVFRLGISVQSLSCFAAARYATIQWEIAWLIGPLQDNISSCFKTYSSSCGFEFQHWRIAWSFSDTLLQHELLSCTCGAVSFFVSEQVQWKIACSLCYDFSVLDNISMRFLCECSAAMNWCKFFQNHVEFSDDRSLKVMVQCSFLELVSCTLSQAHASVFYHGRFVQLGFEFSCLMVWEIDWVRCSMYGQNNKYSLLAPVRPIAQETKILYCTILEHDLISSDIGSYVNTVSAKGSCVQRLHNMKRARYRKKYSQPSITRMISYEEMGLNSSYTHLQLHIFTKHSELVTSHGLAWVTCFLAVCELLGPDFDALALLTIGFQLKYICTRDQWKFVWSFWGSDHRQWHRRHGSKVEIAWLFIKVFSVVALWPQSNGEKICNLYSFLHCSAILSQPLLNKDYPSEYLLIFRIAETSVSKLVRLILGQGTCYVRVQPELSWFNTGCVFPCRRDYSNKSMAMMMWQSQDIGKRKFLKTIYSEGSAWEWQPVHWSSFFLIPSETQLISVLDCRHHEQPKHAGGYCIFQVLRPPWPPPMQAGLNKREAQSTYKWKCSLIAVMDDLFLAVRHFDGSKMFRQPHSEAMLGLHSNYFELVIDGVLQAWYLSCLSGHIIQGAYELMQRKISWLFGNPLLQDWLQICSTGYVPSSSEKFQGKNAWSFDMASSHVRNLERFTVTCHLVIEIGGSLHVSRVELVSCYGHTDEACNTQSLKLNCYTSETLFDWVQSAVQVPWDPGGSTWSRLEGKPNFMKGGLSATSPVLGWIMSCSWALGHGPNQKISEAFTTYTQGMTVSDLAWTGRRLRPIG